MVHFFKIKRGMDSFNMKEVKTCKGFELEGVFTTHMVSIEYGLVFIRIKEIIKGADGNEDTHVEAKVVAMIRKITPKKK